MISILPDNIPLGTLIPIFQMIKYSLKKDEGLLAEPLSDGPLTWLYQLPLCPCTNRQ